MAQRSPSVLAALILATLFLIACAAPTAQAPGTAEEPRQEFITGTAFGLGQEPKRGGIAVVPNRNDPPSAWELMRAGTITLAHMSASMTGDGNLLKPCRQDVSQICHGVAESWEASRDFTHYTLKLRSGVRWHDGAPFTVEDVKFWLDLAYFGVKSGDKTRLAARHKPQMGDIKAVEVLDSSRVRVVLDRPDQLWAAKLAQLDAQTGGGTIWHPKHLMQPFIDRGEVNVAPQDVGFVGIGPFKMLKYEKGGVAQVRRFEGYWEKDEKGRQLPFLDGVDFPIITDPTAMDAALRAGRLDATARGEGFYLTQERYDATKSAMGDRVWFGRMESGMRVLVFNMLRQGPWQDVRVRRAVALWLDKQAAVDAIEPGECCGMLQPGTGPTSQWPNPDWKTWPGFNPATKERDQAEARRLLAEAGYSNGFDITQMCRRQNLFRCEWYVPELGKLGVRAKLDLLDDADWRRRGASGDYDFEVANSPWMFDADVGPELIEGNLARHSVNNFSTLKHEDPKIEEYFRRLRAVPGSLEERVKIWRELERYLVLDQAYGVPTEGQWAVVAHRSHFKGFYIPKRNRANNMDFALAWLDK